jgi:tetratricopeptide (TPR) repeat protein
MNWDDWGLPLGVLGAGLAVGAGLFGFFRDRDTGAVDAAARRAAAEAAHLSVLEALRAHDAMKDRMRPQAWERARQRLLERGAAALRALDGLTEPAPTPEAADAVRIAAARERMGAPAFDAAVAAGGDPMALARALVPEASARTGMAPLWRGALIALACVGIVAALVAFARSDEAPRRDDAMAAPPGAPTRASIDQRLAANPKDLAALNDLTDLAIRTADMQTALDANKRALDVAPGDATARTLKGVLAATVGMYDNALARFDEVLATNPDHLDALVYKGLVALEMGRADLALAPLQRATQLRPADRELAGLLLRAQGGATAPPMAPASPAMEPPPSSGDLVLSGTVDLAPGVTPVPGATFYVSVRDPAGGPPLAAVRRPLPAQFPTTFEVRTGDAIAMGGALRPFPAVLDLSVRLDADGNPMTKDPTEPVASLKGLAHGATGVTVTLAAGS